MRTCLTHYFLNSTSGSHLQRQVRDGHHFNPPVRHKNVPELVISSGASQIESGPASAMSQILPIRFQEHLQVSNIFAEQIMLVEKHPPSCFCEGIWMLSANHSNTDVFFPHSCCIS